jgi:flagellar basal body rod protein FlgB
MNSPLETELSTKLGPSAVIESVGAMDIDPAFELAEMQKNSLVYSVATRRMSMAITEMKTVINVGK